VNPHHTTATIYAAVAVLPTRRSAGILEIRKIPTVVRTKENALRDAATDSVLGTESDDECD
jgi:hypothetical protein